MINWIINNKKMETSQTLRESARSAWELSGLSYSDIKLSDIEMLESFIINELKPFEKSTIQLKLNRSLKKNQKFDKDGRLMYYQFTVNGSYFEKREGISFNNNGFIGFAGWADKYNVKPFVLAFEKWVEALSQIP